METLSAAVVGAGSQGRVHGLGHLAAPGVSRVALTDVRRAAGESTAKELDVACTYQDYHEMPEAHQPDIVSVRTPPVSHLDVVRPAVGTGGRLPVLDADFAPRGAEPHSTY